MFLWVAIHNCIVTPSISSLPTAPVIHEAHGIQATVGPVGREAYLRLGVTKFSYRIWCQTSLWGISRNYPILKTMELMRKYDEQESRRMMAHSGEQIICRLQCINKEYLYHTIGLLNVAGWAKMHLKRVTHWSQKLVSKDNCEIANVSIVK